MRSFFLELLELCASLFTYTYKEKLFTFLGVGFFFSLLIFFFSLFIKRLLLF